MSTNVFLLLGSNLGDRIENLNTAVSKLKERVDLQATSSIYETAPWGILEQPSFLNQVIKATTELTARQLLSHCLSVEEQMGRKRGIKWGERLIDIDILYYHDQVIEESDLMIPHPGIAERRFTLVPLAELAPDMEHPILGEHHTTLLAKCRDNSKVEVYSTV